MSMTASEAPGRAREEGEARARWLAWTAATVLEAGIFAYCAGRIIFGPVSLSPHPGFWIGWVASVVLVYTGLSAVAISPGLPLGRTKAPPAPDTRTWAATAPFLMAYLALLGFLQARPDSVRELAWRLLSPIEPFPTVAAVAGVLAVSLAKSVIALPGSRGHAGGAEPGVARIADVAIPSALLLIGILQASVYITPIGNAFLRSWAIADAAITGTVYPVTITELPTYLAGGPPYIRDLPLFPMLLLAAFGAFGHNTAAAHVPGLVASALFPLSLYLLLREATGRRLLSVSFAAMVSLFPFLRFWVLNLPDPDPLMFTGLCLAGYAYLRASASKGGWAGWFVAGAVGGLLSLVRSEGILYAGAVAAAVMVLRPGWRQAAWFYGGLALILVPMVAVWVASFGVLWPQNFTGTLKPHYPLENLEILSGMDAFGLYRRGLGLDAWAAAGLLVVGAVCVAGGTIAAAVRRPALLALILPGIGNTISIFFTSPGVTNAAHFADFFRHASFGIPYLAVAAAFGLHAVVHGPGAKHRRNLAGYLVVMLLVATIVREGDILANPTATHRPGATQVLTTSTHLSMEAIVEHPMQLPLMTYHWNGEVTVAYPTFMEWPEDILAYFKPLDMSFDSAARPFAYASVAIFLIALGFAFFADRPICVATIPARGERPRTAPDEGWRS